MLVNRLATLTVFAIAALGSSFALAQTTFYVAPNGNDAWSGSLAAPNAEKSDGPFATLQRARDAARTASKKGVTVQVAGGTYELSQPLELSSEDSGAEAAPTVYTAAEGQEVRISGGKAVTAWTPVSDAAILEQLAEPARGKVYEADLKALGIADFGSPDGGGMEVFCNDQRMTLSRWPNNDFVRIVEVIGGEKVDVRGTVGDKIGKWTYEGDEPKRWSKEKDAWVHGYWFWDWSDQRHKIKSIDTEKHIIEVEPPYHGYGYRNGQWYYAFNLLSEIDTPGEWYLDRETGVLYFWPPSDIAQAKVTVSVTKSLLQMNEASHVTVRGLTFEASRATPVNVSGGTGVRIESCTVRNVGAAAVSISGGTSNGVVGCHLYNLAGGGISLSGGDRNTLTPSDLFADNNHIHDYGQFYRMYHAGISLNGVGNRATHNLIHDAPHIGVVFGGNDHIIEYNEIHHVCVESNDAGAIYAGRDWTMRGTQIRYNYMHDISGFENKGCVGVYLDDMYCGTNISDNLFYKVTMAAFIGGGRDNIVSNNLFVDCNPALHIDSRAMGWAADSVPTTMKERLDAVPFKESPWKERYPEILTVWEDEPAAPKGNKVENNLCVRGTWDHVDDTAKKYVDITKNFVNDDPGFATPDAFAEGKTPKATDFALKADSPVIVAGFKPLPLDKMGMQVK
ncbi:MAG: right-handed parallel beta-helix repeat-containing protein [Candidatus Hydrogenedentes bacterium]|nr:right-handed parallel beta-helix repeat-containing protein [Candidatus Hydrogenedentota bacterium]